MKAYLVQIEARIVRQYEIEASDKEGAVERAKELIDRDPDLDYDYTVTELHDPSDY